jgi:hypothetical protein
MGSVNARIAGTRRAANWNDLQKVAAMLKLDRIWEFLQRLSPVTRSCLLNELERLELCGVDIPASADIQARLRAEFRKGGSTNVRANNPSRYFFAPLELLIVDAAPDHNVAGRVPRGSLAPIWEWISRDLLPTMARDYAKSINELTAANKEREAQKVASIFQTKVVKYLESTLSSAEAAEQTRAKLARYTAAKTAYDDLFKIMRVLRAREVLAKFNEALPVKIDNFDDGRVAKIIALLDAFKKSQVEALPFALTLVARRLKTSWQLVRLATKSATSKNAAVVAATPYAIVVSMVLDRLDDKRLALRTALRHNRVIVAKALLADIYSTEYALRVRIDNLDQSDWGVRLHGLMEAITNLVEEEIKRFPPEVGHVFASRSLRRYDSLAGRLTYLAWKGRDAVTGGAGFLKKLIHAA